MKNISIFTWSLIATLLAASCGGKILYPKYYALEIPAAPALITANGTPFSGSVAVRFDSVSYLRQRRIVYRQVPEEIGFYDYHRWVSDPADTLTTAAIDSLRSARLFSSVKRYDGQKQQDYLLLGRLERLDEVDYDNSVRVVTAISAELRNLRTGSTEWADGVSVTSTVDKRNVNAVVLQMGHSVHLSINKLVMSLEQQPTAR